MPAGSSPHAEHVVIPSLSSVRDFQGVELGSTGWMEIDQERIALFARATGDTNWCHGDPERAGRESSWKGTVADPFLLLSLVPQLLPELIEVEGWSTAVNVGADACRFPGAVPAGARVRLRARIARARPLPPDGARLVFEVWFEVEGREEPVGQARVDYAYFA